MNDNKRTLVDERGWTNSDECQMKQWNETINEMVERIGGTKQ
jgi:hypothetical protein